MPSLPGYDEALERALTAVPSRLEAEEVTLAAATDRVLAAPVRADRDLPPFDRAMMDGYAVRSSEIKAGHRLAVAADIAAGAVFSGRIPRGACAKIATGAPVPDGLDAVIQHELSDRQGPVGFTIDRIEPGHAIHPRGADARSGDVVIEPWTRLQSHHLGIAASVGAARLEVTRRPSTLILTSGDEVREVGASVEPHQIRNSNAAMLRDLVHRFGAVVEETRHLPDDRDRTMDAVREAIERADVVVTVGGVSAGDRDHFPAAFEACGVDYALSGAAIQPGKPVRIGRASSGAVVAALPGNPVSVLATAHLFLWPIIRAMLGLKGSLEWERRSLSEDVRPNARRQAFRPAAINDDGTVSVPRWAGSGDLAHTTTTHGLAALPVQDAPVAAGQVIPFVRWA